MNFKKALEEKLREAACFGDLDTLKELILRGVDVNSRNDMNGWTALHWAAHRNNFEAVTILLNSDADKNSLTHKGQLPSDLSSSETVQELLGGKISSNNQFSLPIIPNYIKNPPLCCRNIVKSEGHSAKERESHSDGDMVLKVRLADSLECDFIELELSKSELSLEKLKEVCCRELGIKESEISKIRKLPNTIVRNDRDVQRLQDFQELEQPLGSSHLSCWKCSSGLGAYLRKDRRDVHSCDSIGKGKRRNFRNGDRRQQLRRRFGLLRETAEFKSGQFDKALIDLN